MHASTSTETCIIGAGLSGLLRVYRLQQASHRSLLIEARDRPGGRIFTSRHGREHGEFGATWFWPHHHRMKRLIQEFDIPIVDQYRQGITIQQIHPSFPAQYFDQPAYEDGTMRLAHGSSSLIERLAATLPQSDILFDCPVQRINAASSSNIRLTSIHGQELCVKRVIIAAPPQNMLRRVSFEPELPQHWQNHAMTTTTWMGHVGKCICWFDTAFWRDAGFNGAGFFAGATISELHDVSNSSDGPGALMGFLNADGLPTDSQALRQELVLRQLEHIFPDVRQHFQHYEDYLWFNDPLCHSAPPREHPLAIDKSREALFGNTFFDNRLFWAGSETSRHFPGYLEGAIAAAERCVEQVLSA